MCGSGIHTRGHKALMKHPLFWLSLRLSRKWHPGKALYCRAGVVSTHLVCTAPMHHRTAVLLNGLHHGPGPGGRPGVADGPRQKAWGWMIFLNCSMDGRSHQKAWGRSWSMHMAVHKRKVRACMIRLQRRHVSTLLPRTQLSPFVLRSSLVPVITPAALRSHLSIPLPGPGPVQCSSTPPPKIKAAPKTKPPSPLSPHLYLLGESPECGHVPARQCIQPGQGLIRGTATHQQGGQEFRQVLGGRGGGERLGWVGW